MTGIARSRIGGVVGMRGETASLSCLCCVRVFRTVAWEHVQKDHVTIKEHQRYCMGTHALDNDNAVRQTYATWVYSLNAMNNDSNQALAIQPL